MPTRAEIQDEIQKAATSAQDNVRRRFLRDLNKHTGRAVIHYASAAGLQNFAHAAGALSISNEDMQGFMAACHGLTGDKLDLILHSPGGSLDAAEQIVNYLRAKFSHIRAIVPQNAMSAATMIACACDEIVMGKHSAIGPIDPQITLPRPNRPALALPAQAFLDEFGMAKADIAQNPASAAVWLQKLQELPPGFLQFCANTIERSEQTVALWLEKFMHMPKPDAVEAAQWLARASNHKSHGRPIDAKTAKGLGLKVTMLEDDGIAQDLVLSIFHATMVTFSSTICGKMIENHLDKGVYVQVPMPGR